MKECPNCKSLIDDDAIFCPECGTKVENVRYCVKCGKGIDEDSSFCPYCGAPQNRNDAEGTDFILKESSSIKSPKVAERNVNIDNISPLRPHNEFHSDNKQNSSLKRALLGVVLIILLGGGVFWYMVSPSIDKEEGMEFLEYFYNNGGLREDDDFIRQHITNNAYNWLRENFWYDCYDDDCLANWYFTREPGTDYGSGIEELLPFKHLRGNSFQVSIQYEWGIYYVTLVLKKENESIKIDQIKNYHFISNYH